MNAQVPVWLALLSALAGGVLGFLSNLLTVVMNNKTAKETNRLIQSGRNRETLLLAQELKLRKDDPEAQEQAEVLIAAVVKMRELTPDDAILVQTLTRPANERILAEVQRVRQTGQRPTLRLEGQPQAEKRSEAP